MKIKKISIQGFKSFVDRVQFAFPAGTSVIVGPNGCGKSNIVDAIRWVLGEHNARHLRGNLMEDLIFNGSESRKPTGMAEVTLTLSNDGGKAPARYSGFTEIEVQRRYYRSGDSEYFINKVPARLRDIVDLFTDTGIGSRAYSIIEQGQIGWVITAKPEERRLILEEAAGINKYKQKKDAALRKLDATKDNLTRVSDITSEVKRQLNSLNRQAKKAERYKVFKDELKGLELHTCSLDYGSMNGKKRELDKRIEEFTDRDVELSTRINCDQSSAEETNVEYLRRETEFAEIKERVFEIDTSIQAEERGVELGRLKVDELKRVNARLGSEVEELGRLKGSLGTEARELDESVTSGSELLRAERARLSENESLLAGLDTELNEKETSIRTGEENLRGAEERLIEIRHSIGGLLRERETLNAKIDKAEAEKAEGQEVLDSMAGPIAELIGKIGVLDDGAQAVELELSRESTRLETLEAARADTDARLTDLRQNWSTKSSRLAALEEMERKLDGVDDGARAIINSGHGNGSIHGLIADVIDAEPGFEKAVEAVLGERLRYVIVESQNEGVEAIDYLKTHASGRGSFVPIRDSRPPSYRKFEPAGAAESNGATRLIRKVVVKEGYGKVMDYLLGDVLLVDALTDATRIWRSNGVTRTLVTRDGEMVDPQGIITGGYSNGSSGGILQKRREIKDLSSELKGIEEELSGIEEKLAGTDRDIQQAKLSIESAREKSHSGEIERVNLEGDLKVLEEDKTRLTEKLDTLSTELDTVRGEIEEIKQRADALEAERGGLNNSLEARRGTVGEASQDASRIKAKKENLAGLVTEIKVNAASMAERHQHLIDQRAEKERSIEETRSRIENKKSEMEQVAEEIEQMDELVAGHKSALDQTLRDKDVVRREEVVKGEALAGLREKTNALQEGLKGLREELSDLKEELNSISLEAHETELSLSHTREKIIEKYGVDIENYRTPAEKAAELAERDPEELKAREEELRAKIGSMGEVSLSALEEFNDLEGRHLFLVEQQEDLNRSIESLHATITKINRTTRERFKKTFEEVNEKFRETFPRLFHGGRAELRLVGEGDVLESGVEIVAQPPGKRLQSITLLSGGERALTATALIFSIFFIKPSPFCLLDEVDAPLDDANIDRFNAFVKEMALTSQFILISHNKRTMEIADTLFGITMEEPGISKTVSVTL